MVDLLICLTGDLEMLGGFFYQLALNSVENLKSKQEISQRLKHGNFGKSSSSVYDINYHRNDKRISLYRRLWS